MSSISESVWLPVDYEKRLQAIKPARVEAWFKTQGWYIFEKKALVNGWKVGVGTRICYVFVPKSQSLGDYAARMHEVVECVAVAMDWRGWVAFEHLAAL